LNIKRFLKKAVEVLERGKRVYRQVRKNWKDTYWWKGYILMPLARCFRRRFIGNKGIYVMGKDWDNLIVLDACRYDLFVEVTRIEADYIISRGSSTAEFLKENFAGHKCADIVVVSANPYVTKFVKDSFYEVIPVWKSGWDDKLKTILPETVIESALEAEIKFPDKRLIVWFMQPHFPFIENPEICPHGITRDREIAEFNKSSIPISDPWSEADMGNIEIEKVWQAYKKNLEIVLPYAFKLAQQLKGKNVITADHGNTFERLRFPFPVRIAGHPYGIYIPALVKVPWLVFEGKERKEIREGLPSEQERIKKVLKDLKARRSI
jgi:hypothetical protein